MLRHPFPVDSELVTLDTAVEVVSSRSSLKRGGHVVNFPEHLLSVLPSLCSSKVKTESLNSVWIKKQMIKVFGSYLYLPVNWLLPMQQQLTDTIKKIVPPEKVISSLHPLQSPGKYTISDTTMHILCGKESIQSVLLPPGMLYWLCSHQCIIYLFQVNSARPILGNELDGLLPKTNYQVIFLLNWILTQVWMRKVH